MTGYTMRETGESQTRWRAVAALLGGLSLIGCGGGSGSPTTSAPPAPAAPTGPSAVVVLDASNFDAVVTNGAGVCLVEFYHPSCSHCQAMEPLVERLAADYEGRAVVGKVDVTTEPGITAAWSVPGYPTFVVVRDGSELSRWLGETSYDHLAQMVQAALDAA
jgi:thioredoxin 1